MNKCKPFIGYHDSETCVGVDPTKEELAAVLQVAIARGEELGYNSDEDYQRRLKELNRQIT